MSSAAVERACQAQAFPAPIRDSGLLPCSSNRGAAMLYWLWRVRGRPTLNSGRPEGRQPTGAHS